MSYIHIYIYIFNSRDKYSLVKNNTHCNNHFVSIDLSTFACYSERYYSFGINLIFNCK